jgi:hypothetical protein
MLRNAIAIGLALSLISSCGGEKAVSPQPSQEAATIDANALGFEAGGWYLETLQRVVESLESRPAPATAKAILQSYFDDIVGKFVPVGKVKAGLDRQAKSSFDFGLMDQTRKIGESEWYPRWQEASAHYGKLDAEVQALMSELWISTQYLDFELLASQRPEEIARLGLAP